MRLFTSFTLAVVVTAWALTFPAQAQSGWNSSQIGQFGYHYGTGDNQGWNGTSSNIGPFRYDNYTGPNGQSLNCTTSYIGQFAYTNCN